MDLDINSVVHRQNLFSSTLQSHFLRKVTKYQNVLLRNGIHLSEQSCNSEDILTEPRSQSFEDHIELVIGQKSASPNACKTFWKIGNRISTIKLFRWIYLIVQRTKAARILHHLDGISDTEIQDVIQSVGQEVAVAFEYQLCLLEGDSEIEKLAQHAGACILTYLNCADAHYAPENLLQAILEVKPQSGNNKEILKTRPFYFNNQPVCLRWRLSQVLKQPGLRIIADDVSKVTDNNPKKTDVDTSLCIPSIATDPDNIKDPSVNVNAEFHGNRVENISALDEVETGDVTSGENKIDGDSGKHLPNQTDLMQKGKCRRKISAVDMDYDKGEIKVTEYSVEVSDFSPIGNNTSQLNDGDSTSIEEDLDFEDVSELELGSINDTYQVPTNVLRANALTCTDSDNNVFESTINFQKNNAQNYENCNATGKSDTVSNHAYNTSDSSDLHETNTCNTQTENSNGDTILNVSHENGAACNECNEIQIGAHTTEALHAVQGNKPEISTLEIIQNISDHQTGHTKQDISAHHNLLVTQDALTQQTPYNKPDTYSQQTPPTKQAQISDITPYCLHDQQSLRVYGSESERHIRSSNHITEDTYQSSLEQRNCSTVETSPMNCDDELLSEFTSVEISYSFYGCFTPYGARCRPHIYGYRGPLHVWNEASKQYTLIYNDTVTVARQHQRQVTQSLDDPHQCYVPKTFCRHIIQNFS